MTCFLTPPLFDAPLEFLGENYPEKTRGMWLPCDENCMISASTV